MGSYSSGSGGNVTETFAFKVDQLALRGRRTIRHLIMWTRVFFEIPVLSFYSPCFLSLAGEALLQPGLLPEVLAGEVYLRNRKLVDSDECM